MAKASLLLLLLGLLGAMAAPVDGSNATADQQRLGSNAPSAPVSLFNTLLATFAAVFLGFLCVRTGVIVPGEGHMKGLVFFIGQISYPLLIFKTVATAKFDNVDVGALAACTLGKVIVMVGTWLAVFVAYKTRRPLGQRVLTATIFAFFTISSNDFAIGFPVINALYKDSFDMGIYITGNALVTSACFVPIIMVLLAIGGSLDKKAAKAQATDEEQGEDVGAEGTTGPCLQILGMARDILFNPVIVMTILALLFQVLLGDTLVEDGGAEFRFPDPLYNLVELITQPFGMCALFLTGTSLQTPHVSFLPMFIVTMKVVVCAYVTFFISGMLVGKSLGDVQQELLQDFCFLYGMIPTSSAPLIFANQFAPAVSEQIATAILMGLVVAGPMMLVASMFLEGASLDVLAVLAGVEVTTIAVSLFCGAVLLVLLLILQRDWGYACPYKSLVASYAILLIVYEGFALTMNPHLGHGWCRDFNDHPWSPLKLLLGWLQHSSQVIVLIVQVMTASRRGCGHRTRGPLLLLMALVLGSVPAMTSIPNTITEMCSVLPAADGSGNVVPNLVWSTAYFITTVALIMYRKMHRLRAKQNESICEETGKKEKTQEESEDQEDEENGEHEEDDTSSKHPDLDSWIHKAPKAALTGIIWSQAMRLFMQVVNTSLVFAEFKVDGGFAEMLVLEALLQHSQLALLLVVLLADERFCRLVAQHCRMLAPWLFHQPVRQQSTGESSRVVDQLSMVRHVVPPLVVV